MEDIKRGESSLASFLACIEESISEREGKKFEEGLNSKDMYKRCGKEVEYLHGVGDTGTRLLFKFRSHGLNKSIEVEKANQSVCCVVLSVRV